VRTTSEVKLKEPFLHKLYLWAVFCRVFPPICAL
jgi:hypothetical protein